MKIYEYNNTYIGYLRKDNKVFVSENKNDLIKIQEELPKLTIEKNMLSEESLAQEQKNIQIVYLVTSKCNMQCKYCYEHNFDSSIDEAYSLFDTKKMLKVYEAFRQKFNNSKFTVSFFGGEPFLEIKSIVEFIKKVIEQCNVEGIEKPRFVAITNGTLLNTENCKLIVEYFDSITISIDGLELLHNENRIFKNNKGTFECIYNNLVELNKINENNKLKINSEITLTDAYIKYYDNTLIKRTIEMFKALKFRTVEFIPVISEESYLFDNTESINRINKDIVNYWFDSVLSGEYSINIPSIYQLYLYLTAKHNKITEANCTSGKTYFAIDSEYRIFPCQVSIYQDYNVMGYIKDEQIHMDYEKIKKYKSNAEISICQDCVCVSCCPSFCKVMMNSIKEDEIPPSCLYNELLFKNVLFKLLEISGDEELKNKFNKCLLSMKKSINE